MKLEVKGGEGGRLFGSITAKDIADAIEQQIGTKIDKKKIQLKDPIKNAGSYEVEVRLHPAATAKIGVQVEVR